MSTPTAWNISDVAHISFIESVAWSPDGANLAYVIASPDSMANKYRRSIWLRRGNAAPRRFSAGTAGDRSPVWSPDGQWLAFVSNRGGDAQIYVIAVDGGEAEAITAIPTGASSPVWSPDGQYIVSASNDKTIRIWDALTQRQIGNPLTVHTHWVYSVEYSPDGRHIVSGSSDNTIRIWDNPVVIYRSYLKPYLITNLMGVVIRYV